MSCDKCGRYAKHPFTVVIGGAFYLLCETCETLYDIMPTGAEQDFIPNKKEFWVARNMREARERRAKGISLWN